MCYLKRIVMYEGDFYYIRDAYVSGKMCVKALTGKLAGREVVIDPMVNRVFSYDATVIAEWSVFSSSLLQILDSLKVREGITSMVCYKNGKEDILVALRTEDKFRVYLYCEDGLYMVTEKDGKKLKPKGCSGLYEICSDFFPDVEWCEGLRVFRLPCERDVYMKARKNFNTLLVGSGVSKPVRMYIPEDVSMLCRVGSVEFLHLEFKDLCCMVEKSKLEGLLKELGMKPSRLRLKAVRGIVEEFLENPCIAYSDDELDKISAILSINGYNDVCDMVRKYNGKRSNYYIKSRKESVSIITNESNSRLYTIYVNKPVPVLSSKGIPMYWELRQYPIGNPKKYKVIAASVKYDLIDFYLRYAYADLLRGTGVMLSGYDFVLYSIKDSENSFSIKYYNIYNKAVMYTADYDKGKNLWSGGIDGIDALDWLQKLSKYVNIESKILEV